MGNYRNGKIENLNWYPGHMKKTRELITDSLKLTDAVIETVDARIPVSSRNPVIDGLINGKPRIVALNKSDLADRVENERWVNKLKSDGYTAILTDCGSGAGMDKIIKALDELQEKRDREKPFKRKLRLMIAGVPNVGKSSLINRLTGRKSTKTGNRPGVTKGKQWLMLENGMQLLDTPGILWPKFEDPKAGINLAFCGSIKDEIMDIETLALELIGFLSENYGNLLAERYKIELNGNVQSGEEPYSGALDIMEDIAKKRGFIFSGKRIDYSRTAHTVLEEFRSGKIGRITLEKAG